MVPGAASPPPNDARVVNHDDSGPRERNEPSEASGGPEGRRAAGTDVPAPVGGNWLRCYASFQPRTQPKLDVTRLGLMCGPVNGMKKLADPPEATVDGDGGTGRQHAWTAEAGDCYRIFAVADPSVEDLDVEVFAPGGQRVAFDTGDDRWPLVNPDGPFCVFDAGEYRAVVKAPRSGGTYAIQIWRLR